MTLQKRLSELLNLLDAIESKRMEVGGWTRRFGGDWGTSRRSKRCKKVKLDLRLLGTDHFKKVTHLRSPSSLDPFPVPPLGPPKSLTSL